MGSDNITMLLGIVMLLNIISVKVIVKFCTLISVLKLVVVGFLLACGIAVIAKGQGKVSVSFFFYFLNDKYNICMI